jgi:hypothetical protein
MTIYPIDIKELTMSNQPSDDAAATRNEPSVSSLSGDAAPAKPQIDPSRVYGVNDIREGTAAPRPIDTQREQTTGVSAIVEDIRASNWTSEDGKPPPVGPRVTDNTATIDAEGKLQHSATFETRGSGTHAIDSTQKIESVFTTGTVPGTLTPFTELTGDKKTPLNYEFLTSTGALESFKLTGESVLDPKGNLGSYTLSADLANRVYNISGKLNNPTTGSSAEAELGFKQVEIKKPNPDDPSQLDPTGKYRTQLTDAAVKVTVDDQTKRDPAKVDFDGKLKLNPDTAAITDYSASLKVRPQGSETTYSTSVTGEEAKKSVIYGLGAQSVSGFNANFTLNQDTDNKEPRQAKVNAAFPVFGKLEPLPDLKDPFKNSMQQSEENLLTAIHGRSPRNLEKLGTISVGADYQRDPKTLDLNGGYASKAGTSASVLTQFSTANGDFNLGKFDFKTPVFVTGPVPKDGDPKNPPLVKAGDINLNIGLNNVTDRFNATLGFNEPKKAPTDTAVNGINANLTTSTKNGEVLGAGVGIRQDIVNLSAKPDKDGKLPTVGSALIGAQYDGSAKTLSTNFGTEYKPLPGYKEDQGTFFRANAGLNVETGKLATAGVSTRFIIDGGALVDLGAKGDFAKHTATFNTGVASQDGDSLSGNVSVRKAANGNGLVANDIGVKAAFNDGYGGVLSLGVNRNLEPKQDSPLPFPTTIAEVPKIIQEKHPRPVTQITLEHNNNAKEKEKGDTFGAYLGLAENGHVKSGGVYYTTPEKGNQKSFGIALGAAELGPNDKAAFILLSHGKPMDSSPGKFEHHTSYIVQPNAFTGGGRATEITLGEPLTPTQAKAAAEARASANQAFVDALPDAQKELYKQAFNAVNKMNAERGTNMPVYETTAAVTRMAVEGKLTDIASIRDGKWTAEGHNLFVFASDGKQNHESMQKVANTRESTSFEGIAAYNEKQAKEEAEKAPKTVTPAGEKPSTEAQEKAPLQK